MINPSDISLRPFNLNDLDDYFALITDDQVSQFCNWNIHITKEEAKAYLKEKIIPDPWFKAICLRDRPMGDVMVTRARGSNRCRAEIGYTLSSMYWGQGIATQVVKMVVSGIFEEMEGLERVEALIDVENVRSHRVIEKAGFVKEGVLKKYWLLMGRARDMVVYSFLRPDRVGEARFVAMECLIARKIGGKGVGSTLVILGVFVLPALLFARKKSYA